VLTEFSEIGCLRVTPSNTIYTPLGAASYCDQGYDALVDGPKRVMGGRGLSRKGVISVPFALVAVLLVLVELAIVFSAFFVFHRRL
jgi:hypothetical protein